MRKGTAILTCCILPAGARQIDGTTRFWLSASRSSHASMELQHMMRSSARLLTRLRDKHIRGWHSHTFLQLFAMMRAAEPASRACVARQCSSRTTPTAGFECCCIPPCCCLHLQRTASCETHKGSPLAEALSNAPVNWCDCATAKREFESRPAQFRK